MKSTIYPMVLVVCVAVFGNPLLQASAQLPEAEINKDKTAWVQKCLTDFQTIKVGMTRSEVEQKFPLDGGLHGASLVHFTHPACPYFKVDVAFDFQRDPADHNRAIMGKNDKVTQVSKPYIELPFGD